VATKFRELRQEITMETEVQNSPEDIERRLSYCEINVKDPGNPRVGAGCPEEMLNLPDDGTNIRFFMLDPLAGVPWRARWYTGEIDEVGKITTHPPMHPSQMEGAWAGFFLPLIPLTARIVRGIAAGRFHEEASDGRAAWIRVRPKGLSVASIPGPPTLASLLEDRPEARWWPVYVRLLGDATALSDLLEILEREDVHADIEPGAHE
jgi:hypothetical protein